MSNRTTSPSVSLDTGLGAKDRRKVGEHLVKALADTYVLLLKTHAYHWNVVGPLFVPLHELTESHYEDMFEAADELAERIRALGLKAPMSFQQLLPKTMVEEEKGDKSALAMVESLVSDHETLCQRLRQAGLAADEVDDLVTTDLMTRRLAFHEKAIWMLGATISA